MKVSPSRPRPALPSQAACAEANARLIHHLWWGSFSVSALLQMFIWPTSDNMLCVLFAWTACMATGVVILRGRVTFLHPWSSLIVLMFCLSMCGLPLLLMLLQGDPITARLQVPVQTFFHIFICQIILLVIHLIYRNLPICRHYQDNFRNKVLRPLGFFIRPSFVEIMAIGAIGLIASVYNYLIPTELGSRSRITGPVIDQIVQGLIPFAAAPFLVVFPHLLNAPIRRSLQFAMLFVFASAIFFVAAGVNSRSYFFVALAVPVIAAVLIAISGQLPLKGQFAKFVAIGTVLFALVATVGSDIAAAMRVARGERETVPPLELVQDTLALLTTHRNELNAMRTTMSEGGDLSEAWYVTSPVFSRLVITHFQDKFLAIGLALDSRQAEVIRRSEMDYFWSAFPNPLLKILGVHVDKNEVGQESMGAVMEGMSGMANEQLTGNKALGGFIGDGYAAYGWGYLLPFGGVALVLFLLGDSFYLLRANQTSDGRVWSGTFAMVLLIYGYQLISCLTGESIGELIGFVIRQPVQWLVLYSVVFAVVRITFRTFTSHDAHPASGNQAVMRKSARIKGLDVKKI